MYMVKKRLRAVPCYTGRWKKPREKKKTSRVRRSSLLNKLTALRRSFVRYVGRINRRIGTLTAIIRRLSNETNQLQSQVSQLERQVNLITTELSTLVVPIQRARAILQARIGNITSIETDAGSISGTIVTVGIDYVHILEPTGDIILLPISSITAIN
jgi:chromosome segregation ATPase